MKIAMIAAMANNRVIGKNNQMPWYLPEDLRHFKAITLGKPVLMGRKTYDSIGKPLPKRHNIVITRQTDWCDDGVTSVSSFDAAIAAAGDCDELIVIGGGQLYKMLLARADKLYLTEINMDVIEGDTHFPHWNDGSWKISHGDAKISDNKLEYRFIEATRKL